MNNIKNDLKNGEIYYLKNGEIYYLEKDNIPAIHLKRYDVSYEGVILPAFVYGWKESVVLTYPINIYEMSSKKIKSYGWIGRTISFIEEEHSNLLNILKKNKIIVKER